MSSAREFLRGWRLVGAVVQVLIASCAAVLLVGGVSEQPVRLVIRLTARTSATLFTLAFVAPALAVLRPGQLIDWLRDNGPYLLISFAGSHLLHAAAIFTLAMVTAGASLAGRGADIILGGLVYLTILALAAGALKRGGPSRWGSRLYTAGLWIVWLIFQLDYVGKTVAESVAFLPAALLLAAAAGVRLLACLRVRRGQRLTVGEPVRPDALAKKADVETVKGPIG